VRVCVCVCPTRHQVGARWRLLSEAGHRLKPPEAAAHTAPPPSCSPHPCCAPQRRARAHLGHDDCEGRLADEARLAPHVRSRDHGRAHTVTAQLQVVGHGGGGRACVGRARTNDGRHVCLFVRRTRLFVRRTRCVGHPGVAWLAGRGCLASPPARYATVPF